MGIADFEECDRVFVLSLIGLKYEFPLVAPQPPQFPAGCRAAQIQLDKGSEAAGGIVGNHVWLG